MVLFVLNTFRDDRYGNVSVGNQQSIGAQIGVFFQKYVNKHMPCLFQLLLESDEVSHQRLLSKLSSNRIGGEASDR